MCVLKFGGFVWPVLGGGCGEQRGVVGATGVATLASILARAQAVVVVVVFVSKLLDVRSMQLPASAELNHCQRFPVTSPPGFVCISHSRLLHMLSPFPDGHASRAASVSPSSAACRALPGKGCPALPRPVREEKYKYLPNGGPALPRTDLPQSPRPHQRSTFTCGHPGLAIRVAMIRVGALLCLVLCASAGVVSARLGLASSHGPDYDALMSLYNGLGGSSWAFKDGWGSSASYCTWHGIRCTSGRVTSLNLMSNGLTGSLPASFAQLSALRNV